MMKERIRQALSQREKKVIKNKGLALAAILMPMYEKAEGYYIILTKRTEGVSYHKGQISFPGGGHQAGDKTFRATALRESWEEIGLNPNDVEILGELDDTETITNFVISPFVAAIPYPYEFNPNPQEVEEIIEVPIAALLDKSNFKEEQKYRDGKLVYEYSFEYSGWVIWGATARILKQLLEVVFGYS